MQTLCFQVEVTVKRRNLTRTCIIQMQNSKKEEEKT